VRGFGDGGLLARLRGGPLRRADELFDLPGPDDGDDDLVLLPERLADRLVGRGARLELRRVGRALRGDDRPAAVDEGLDDRLLAPLVLGLDVDDLPVDGDVLVEAGEHWESFRAPR
jgi:hypothetical protein